MERVQRISPVPISAGRAVRRREAGDTWKSAAASVLLHVCLGTAAVWGVSGTPEDRIPVIDLTLAESGAGPAQAAIGPKGISVSRSAAPVPAIRSGIPPEEERPAAADPAIPGPAASATASAVVPLTDRLPPPAARPDPAMSTARGGTELEVARGPGVGSPLPATAAAPAAPPGEGTGAAGGAGGAGGNPAATEAGRSTADGAPPGFSYIRDAVQRSIVYPASARRMGWEGTVVVGFRVMPDGSVRGVHVVKRSGHPVLDRSATDAVRNASPFPRPTMEAEVVTPVIYKLKSFP